MPHLQAATLKYANLSPMDLQWFSPTDHQNRYSGVSHLMVSLLSQPLWPTSMWPFFSFSTHVGVAQLVFRPFSEEIVACVAVDSVCPWEEVSSGSWWIAILSHLLRLHFMFHFSPSFPFPKAYKLFSEPHKMPGIFCFVLMIAPEIWTIAQKETLFLLNVLQ